MDKIKLPATALSRSELARLTGNVDKSLAMHGREVGVALSGSGTPALASTLSFVREDWEELVKYLTS
jgi:hypothetical protein